jgi:methionine synthase I (cobalamin-dependent)
LDTGGVVCAEGYLSEMERRGYLTSGEFVPEVALENPEALKILHQDFQHAGSNVIKKTDLPAVVTIAPMAENIMRDDWQIVDTSRELEQRGADVVGMNCFRGPATMMPYLKKIRQAVSCHMAALPVPCRTTEKQPTFFNLDDTNGCAVHSPHGRTFPTALDPL